MKVLRAILIAVVLTVGCLVLSFKAAIVTEKNISQKKVEFDLSAGDKIYVFEAGANVRVYCTPKVARKYYLKVPEGKTFKGTWVLK